MSSKFDDSHTSFYPGPFSSIHKYHHRKMLVTFSSYNKENTIKAALSLLEQADIKADESLLNEIYDNKLFYKYYYILPFFRPKKSIKAYLESFLFTDEIILFENERELFNQNFIDACGIFDIPIRFIKKETDSDTYSFISNEELIIKSDPSRINELVLKLAKEDYSRYPRLEIDIEHACTPFWKDGVNIRKYVPYVGLPQLLYRRIYEWGYEYLNFAFEYKSDFPYKYFEESKWIFNELKSRIGQYVKITLSNSFM